MKKTNNSQALKESIQNEIGPVVASRAVRDSILKSDPRSKQIIKDAVASVFSKYIGKNVPFNFMAREEDGIPIKYELIEVAPRIAHPGEVDFYFYNEGGVEEDAPYALNKKNIVITYDIEKDEFNDKPSNIFQYFINAFTANFFVKAANNIRKMYYTAMPVTLLEPKKDKPWESEYVPDPDFNMNSKVKKQDFRQTSFDSKSMSLSEESNKKIKPITMKLTTKKFKELIKEEVQKIKKKTILENKEKEIKFQLRLLKESYEEETVSVCDDCDTGVVKQHYHHDSGEGWGVCDECGSIEGPTTEMTWDEKEILDSGESIGTDRL